MQLPLHLRLFVSHDNVLRTEALGITNFVATGGEDHNLCPHGRSDLHCRVSEASQTRGITYCPEERIADYISRGELQVLLPDWAPIEPAFHIYYPGSRQMVPSLRKLTDLRY